MANPNKWQKPIESIETAIEPAKPRSQTEVYKAAGPVGLFESCGFVALGFVALGLVLGRLILGVLDG